MDRLSTLIRANVNDMIDRAEDPEKMLDQILRDMQSNITTARAQVASMIAQEKELEADFDETQRLALEWGTKAKRAVDASKDDLAREALRRKRDNEENSRVYSQQLTIQKQTVTKLKDQMRQLEAKYQSTLSQRDTLLARQRRAKAQARVAETLTTFSPMDPTADLERMERKIRSGEAKAAAMIEMGDESFDTQFAELDYDVDIEAELAALKGEPVAAGVLAAGSSESSDEPTAGPSAQPS
ncbi:MAG: PspA/IM30 family protein [Thermomicrobiales bacterium]